MQRAFNASIVHEDGLFVAQCLEVDVASQGNTEEEALQNLAEALELYFEEPQATVNPVVRGLQVTIRAK